MMAFPRMPNNFQEDQLVPDTSSTLPSLTASLMGDYALNFPMGFPSPALLRQQHQQLQHQAQRIHEQQQLQQTDESKDGEYCEEEEEQQEGRRPVRRSARKARATMKREAHKQTTGKKRKASTTAVNEADVIDAELLKKEADGTLSPAEVTQLKKQRRLLKNRAAAQQFRHRQKEYITNLEVQVQELSAYKSESDQKITLLELENKLLKEHLGHLRAFVNQSLTLKP